MTGVAVLSHSAAPSGGELAMGRLLPRLAACLDLLFVCFEDGPMVEDAEAAGVSTVVVPLPVAARQLRRTGLGRHSAAGYMALLRHASEPALRDAVQGRVLYSNSQKAHVVAAMLSRRGGAHGWILHQREFVAAAALGPIAWATAQVVAARADLLVANSESTARSLRLVRESRKVVVPSPVDIEAFGARDPRPAGAALRILMVASMVPQKGADVLLGALRLVPPSLEVELKIAGGAQFGDLAYQERIRRQANELTSVRPGLTIELLGHRSDVPDLMRSADVLVAPSRRGEGMGQVIVQARAAALPVIASDVPGYRDLVDPGRNGLLVKPEDPGALAEALVLYSDQRLATKLCRLPDPGLGAFRDETVLAKTLQAVQRLGVTRID